VAIVCGRFVATTPVSDLVDHFGVERVAERDLDEGRGGGWIDDSWNVAPTDRVAAIAVRRDERTLGTFRWGLVPSWAKELTIGSKLINARAETVATKPAFRKAFEKRRCIVPADGFYEWEAVPGAKKKQPWYVHDPSGAPLAFAGLWEVWRDPAEPDSELVRTCTIVTTTANDLMARIHDRMPVLLPEREWERWLDPGFGDVDALSALLVPAPDGALVMHPVSTAVSNVRNQGPDLVTPIPPPAPATPGFDQLPLA
jgi:putative SOS response-associated peptidase YedK